MAAVVHSESASGDVESCHPRAAKNPVRGGGGAFLSEDQMQTITGEVCKFLEDGNGELNGLVLNSGQEVRFPANHGHLVLLVAVPGSQITVEGILCPDGHEGNFLDAILITNDDTQRTVTLEAPIPQGEPGMPSAAGANPRTSLASPSEGEAGSVQEVTQDVSAAGDVARSTPGTANSRSSAANHIGQAYDGLHRIHAILAYLHIMKRQVAGIHQFLDEAKHTYEQAISRYESRSFEAASELAEASRNLSRIVEIVIGRTLRADTSFPTLVRRPPELTSSSVDSGHVEEDLALVESLLTRIHRLLESHKLPLEDQTQARKIASWGDALYHQAQRMYHEFAFLDAAELAQAALAGANSAEHVCRKWIVGHSSHVAGIAGDGAQRH